MALLFFLLNVGFTAAQSLGSSIPGGTDINAGSYLLSPDGWVKLVMQADGNLVEYYLPTGTAIWATNTNGPNRITKMQTDGNLVVYSPTGALWASNTFIPGATLSLENNGLIWIRGVSGVQVLGAAIPDCDSPPLPPSLSLTNPSLMNEIHSQRRLLIIPPPANYLATKMSARGDAGSAFTALPKASWDLIPQATGGDVALARHHLVPWAQLRTFWNKTVDHGITYPCNKCLFAYMEKAVSRSTFEPFRTAATKSDVGGVFQNLAQGRIPSTTDFNTFLNVYTYWPGNIFIGPESRADDPGDSFEAKACDVSSKPTANPTRYSRARDLNAAINTYVNNPNAADNLRLCKVASSAFKLLAESAFDKMATLTPAVSPRDGVGWLYTGGQWSIANAAC